MRDRTFSVLFLILLAAAFDFAAAQDKHTITGVVETHKDFQSSILPSKRDILVYVPPGYQSNTRRRYSVLYLHDGQNLFDGATSFIKGAEWKVDETAQSLIKAGAIEPIIIVGIYNTGTSRIDEYTPTADTAHSMGGKGPLYARMIVDELKPFIDSKYRTLTGAANTAIGGSSLGALISLYIALKHSDTFGKLAVVSPSIWWDGNMILREVQALGTKPRLRIWLDIGTKEGGNQGEDLRSVENARLLRDALLAKGWKNRLDLKYFEARGAEHNERAWAQRVGPMLRFLFPRR